MGAAPSREARDKLRSEGVRWREEYSGQPGGAPRAMPPKISSVDFCVTE
jgi:hypothetical protein